MTEATTTPTSEATAERRDLTIVQARVHELIRAKDKRVSDKFLVALSEHVEKVISKSVERATANGRSTVRPEDI
jgi:histone H3/H4